MLKPGTRCLLFSFYFIFLLFFLFIFFVPCFLVLFHFLFLFLFFFRITIPNQHAATFKTMTKRQRKLSKNVTSLIRRCTALIDLLKHDRTAITEFRNGRIILSITDDAERTAFQRLKMDNFPRSREKFWSQTAKHYEQSEPNLKKLHEFCCVSIANANQNGRLLRTVSLSPIVTDDSQLQQMFELNILQLHLAAYYQTVVDAFFCTPEHASSMLAGAKRTIVQLDEPLLTSLLCKLQAQLFVLPLIEFAPHGDLEPLTVDTQQTNVFFELTQSELADEQLDERLDALPLFEFTQPAGTSNAGYHDDIDAEFSWTSLLLCFD